MENKNKLEKRFKELFFDDIGKIEIKFNFNQDGKNFHNKYYYNKFGEYFGDYDQETKYFWLSYSKIWSKLESEFTINNQEVRELIKGTLENHYKLKGVTPLNNIFNI